MEGQVHRQRFPACVLGSAPGEVEVDRLDQHICREQEAVLLEPAASLIASRRDSADSLLERERDEQVCLIVGDVPVDDVHRCSVTQSEPTGRWNRHGQRPKG